MKRSAALPALVVAVAVPLAVTAGCKQETPPEPAKPDLPAVSPSARAVRPQPSARPALSARTPFARKPAPVHARPVASVAASDDDPLKGKWALADATKDIKGKGALLAQIETDLGTVTCELFEDKAPITVANFVGLATGNRPWKGPDGKWVKKPAYDGTTFHRIIKGFMIQGGDAAGTGAGQPGYVIPDEIWENALHDRPGQLCMANRGPNTNGAQFFITDGAAAHLDNRYTIFGECAPVDTVHKLAATEVRGEKPVTPPKIKKVTIKRGPSPVPPASASAAASASAPPGASAPAPAPSAAPAASH